MSTTITVKELKRDLENYSDHLEVYFGGLDFYRLKDRGDTLQVEFNQTVYKDSTGKVIVENHR